MLVVGLTGNIASGKSTVARALVQLGARVIDADHLARRAVEPGTPGLQAIVDRWGTDVLARDGTLDRAALRSIVFRDRAELEALNAIVHPEVERLRRMLLDDAATSGELLVVCDIPLLYETGLDPAMDRVVLVHADDDVRLARLVDQRKIAVDEARAMMHTQLSSASKRDRADYVIENSGSIDELQRQVETVWSKLVAEARARQA